MPLLSSIIVQAARPAARTVFSSAVRSALPSAIAQAARAGIGAGVGAPGGAGGSTSYAPQAVHQVRGQPGTTDIAPVDVMGSGGLSGGAGLIPALAPALGGAVGQVIGQQPTDVAPVTVTPSAQQDQPPSVDPALAAAAARGADLQGIDVTAPPRQQDEQPQLVAPVPIPGNLSTLQDPGTLVAEEQQPQERQGNNEALLAALGAAGLIATPTLLANAAGGIQPPSDQSIGDWVKDHAKELVAAGLVVPALAGASGDNGTGSAADGLNKVAQGNLDLAHRLTGIASAGFAGQIGGAGLNYIRRMVEKAQASIRQRYANMGMSGSSAEMEDLNAAAQEGVDLQFKIGHEMATAGLNAIAGLTGQSAQAYLALLNAGTAKETALGQALANFAAAVIH